MSRIGKLPVEVPAGVHVALEGLHFSARGPLGSLERDLPPKVAVRVEGNEVIVEREDESRTARSMPGLARTLINNMVNGVNTGFAKTLDINGVGYRVEQKNDYLVFTLGYSHLIYYEVPAGVDAKIESATKLTVSGVDKQQVGACAAEIRSFRPPEPYKGKGIKYSDETIRRKEGKSGAR